MATEAGTAAHKSMEQRERARRLATGEIRFEGSDSVAGQDFIRQQTTALVKQEERGFARQSLDQLEQALQRAIREGSTIEAEAIQNVMLSQGGRGLEAFNNSVMAAENAGHMEHDSQMRGALSENMRTNHAGAMMKDFGTRQWAQSQDMMGASQARWSGAGAGDVSAQDFAGMSAAAQMRYLGVQEVRDAQGNVSYDFSGVHGGQLSDAAIAALSDSSSELGRGITAGGASHTALQQIAAQRGVRTNAPSQASTVSADDISGMTAEQTRDFIEDAMRGRRVPPNNQPPAPPSTP